MNLLKKKINKESLFIEYVKILNGVLQLSNREAEVFSFLLKEDYDTAKFSQYTGNVNTKGVRARIRGKFNISEANLSRYLGTLKSKKLLVKGVNGKWVINNSIKPIITDGVFELKFILDTNA